MYIMRKLLIILVLIALPSVCNANDRMMYMGTQDKILYFVDIDSYIIKDDGHMIIGTMIDDRDAGIVGAFVYDVNREERTFTPLSSALIRHGVVTDVPVDGTVYKMESGSMIEKAINIILKINAGYKA